MWGSNIVGLHIFVLSEKSNLEITSELKGEKLITSKNVAQQ